MRTRTVTDKKELEELYKHCQARYEEAGKPFQPMGFTPRLAEVSSNNEEMIVSFSNANLGVTYFWKIEW